MNEKRKEKEKKIWYSIGERFTEENQERSEAKERKKKKKEKENRPMRQATPSRMPAKRPACRTPSQ